MTLCIGNTGLVFSRFWIFAEASTEEIQLLQSKGTLGMLTKNNTRRIFWCYGTNFDHVQK